jgi:hypothetical protein
LAASTFAGYDDRNYTANFIENEPELPQKPGRSREKVKAKRAAKFSDYFSGNARSAHTAVIRGSFEVPGRKEQ